MSPTPAPAEATESAQVVEAPATSGAEARLKLRDTLTGVHAAVVTTTASDGLLRSRPLTLLQLDDEARL